MPLVTAHMVMMLMVATTVAAVIVMVAVVVVVVVVEVDSHQICTATKDFWLACRVAFQSFALA